MTTKKVGSFVSSSVRSCTWRSNKGSSALRLTRKLLELRCGCGGGGGPVLASPKASLTLGQAFGRRAYTLNQGTPLAMLLRFGNLDRTPPPPTNTKCLSVVWEIPSANILARAPLKCSRVCVCVSPWILDSDEKNFTHLRPFL